MFKSINADFFELLTCDINSHANVRETRDEIYSNRRGYHEIGGMQMGVNLIKRILTTGQFNGLAYEQKIKINKQMFSGND